MGQLSAAYGIGTHRAALCANVTTTSVRLRWRWRAICELYRAGVLARKPCPYSWQNCVASDNRAAKWSSTLTLLPSGGGNQTVANLVLVSRVLAWQRLCSSLCSVRDYRLGVAFAGRDCAVGWLKSGHPVKNVKLRDTRLRTRLVGGFLLMAAIAASIGIMGITHLRAMRRADFKLYQRSTAPLPAIAHISVTFLKIIIALRDVL